MDMLQINKLRKDNEVPFKVLNWLEKLNPMVEHDDFGRMYKGCVLAEDIYGKYAAIIGTTDQLLKTSLDETTNGTQYRILKIEKFW